MGLSRADRIVGSLWAGAVGDALGYAIEFDSMAQVRRRYGPNGIRELALTGGRARVSDDTQMTLFTAEGLVLAHRRGQERGIWHPPSLVWDAYQRWYRTQRGRPEPGAAAGWLLGFEPMWAARAPGNTCLSALAAARMGTVEEPPNTSKGCGTVMRVAPVGWAGLDDPFTVGVEVSVLTHGHPSGYLSAGALALLIDRLVGGAPWEEALASARQRLAGCGGAAGEALAAWDAGVASGERGGVGPEGLEDLGGGWTAEEALAIALACVVALGAADPLEALRRSANHSGDSDSTASVTGHLLGAMHGAGFVPRSWCTALDVAPAIERTAAEFLTAFATDDP